MPLATTSQKHHIIYNITGLVVAALNNNNTFGDPEFVKNAGTLSWSYDSDNDQIKAFGQITELLTIVLNASGTLTRADMDLPTMNILTGFALGSDTNYDQLRMQVGGAGLPYFGMIARYANLAGESAYVGFPKMKLDTAPAFSVDQNKFRTDETNWKAVAPSTNVRLLNEQRFYHQNTMTLPETGADFDAFFSGFFA